MGSPDDDLWVLDALVDDIECLDTVVERFRRLDNPAVPRLGRSDCLAALRRLTQEGLIDAWEHPNQETELVPVGSPELDDAAIARYWFKPSLAGQARWKAWDA